MLQSQCPQHKTGSFGRGHTCVDWQPICIKNRLLDVLVMFSVLVTFTFVLRPSPLNITYTRILPICDLMCMQLGQGFWKLATLQTDSQPNVMIVTIDLDRFPSKSEEIEDPRRKRRRNSVVNQSRARITSERDSWSVGQAP